MKNMYYRTIFQLHSTYSHPSLIYYLSFNKPSKTPTASSLFHFSTMIFWCIASCQHLAILLSEATGFLSRGTLPIRSLRWIMDWTKRVGGVSCHKIRLVFLQPPKVNVPLPPSKRSSQVLVIHLGSRYLFFLFTSSTLLSSIYQEPPRIQRRLSRVTTTNTTATTLYLSVYSPLV